MTFADIIIWIKIHCCFSVEKEQKHPTLTKEFPFAIVNISQESMYVYYRKSSSFARVSDVSQPLKEVDTRNPVIEGILNDKRAAMGMFMNARARSRMSLSGNISMNSQSYTVNNPHSASLPITQMTMVLQT